MRITTVACTVLLLFLLVSPVCRQPQEVNLPPDVPSEPSGPVAGHSDTAYLYTTSSLDPESGLVACRFTWGDGDTSDWSDFSPADGEFQAEHAWCWGDSFPVSAQAKDEQGVLSDWSDALSVVIQGPEGFPCRVADTLDPGSTPSALVLSPDHQRLYVGTWGYEILVFNTLDNVCIDTIPVNGDVHDMCITPDEEHLYVSDYCSSVEVIRVSDKVSVALLQLTCPDGIAVLPSGEFVYVAMADDRKVAVIRTSDNTVVTYVDVGSWPFKVLPSLDGKRVYVGCYGAGEVYVIRTSDNTVTDRYNVGDDPTGLVLSPEGDMLYVGDECDGLVTVVNTATGRTEAEVKVSDYAWALGMTPDGRYLYVGDYEPEVDAVTILRTSDNAIVAKLAMDEQSAVSFACPRDLDKVFVALEDDEVIVVLEKP